MKIITNYSQTKSKIFNTSYKLETPYYNGPTDTQHTHDRIPDLFLQNNGNK